MSRNLLYAPRIKDLKVKVFCQNWSANIALILYAYWTIIFSDEILSGYVGITLVMLVLR